MNLLIQLLKENHLELAEKMIQDAAPYQLLQQDEKGHSLLHIAVQNNQLGIVDLLLKKGVNVNCEANDEHHKYMLPLHYAALLGHLKMAKLLIFWGANLNAENDKFQTPQLLAREKGHHEIAQLIEKYFSSAPCVNINTASLIPKDLYIKQALNLRQLDKNDAIKNTQTRQRLGRYTPQKNNVVDFVKYKINHKKYR